MTDDNNNASSAPPEAAYSRKRHWAVVVLAALVFLAAFQTLSENWSVSWLEPGSETTKPSAASSLFLRKDGSSNLTVSSIQRGRIRQGTEEQMARNQTTTRNTRAAAVKANNKNVVDTTTTTTTQTDSTSTSSRGQNTIRAAICHRALFGRTNLIYVKRWAEYNYLLGFEHLFVWYLAAIRNYTGFDELNALPYVTLLQEDAGTPQGTWKSINEEHFSQRKLILQCLRNQAKDFDWVMFADADEFLWFNETIDLQEFLYQQQEKQFNYLSFGKMEYDMSHHVNVSHDIGGFGVARYPYTAGSYCRPQKANKRLFVGSSWCPANRGRSKVLLMPSKHNWTDIHGSTKFPNPATGMIHFDTQQAHYKEWIGLYGTRESVLMSPPEDFVVSKRTEVSVHHIKKSFQPNENGTYTMHYDTGLHNWLEFVASRRRRSNSQQSSSAAAAAAAATT